MSLKTDLKYEKVKNGGFNLYIFVVFVKATHT